MKKIRNLLNKLRRTKVTNEFPKKDSNDYHTILWIFLAIKMASEHEPAKFNSISMIADGINHAVPTHKELQTSIKWLLEKDLIIKESKKYRLSEKGKEVFERKEIGNTEYIHSTWEKLKSHLINIK